MAENSKPLDPLLDLLVQNGVLDDGQVETILEEAKNPTGKTLRQILIDGEYVTEDDLLGMMAAYQGCEVVDLSDMTLDTDTVQSIPTSVARMYNVLAVAADDTSVTLATSDLIDPRVSDELAFVLTKEVRFVMAREEDVRNRISQYYGDDTESVADMLKSLGSGMDMDETIKSDPNDVAALEGAANNNAVVKFVNLILYQGVVDRAADIAINVAGRPVDLRVSCLPTVHGESVVMRILDQSATSLDLENVGLAEDVYEQITMDIEKPNGIIVVTGPTGSGKTTTLYSVLRRINSIDTKILTAEEPVEYDVDGIVQVPINHEVGNTFPKVLRAFLRQDPDIMLIGEIRDLETAEVAIQAALTGHLVFSTLHTNDAAGAVMRFVDMNVPPYMVASTLEAVLGQRLLRTCCKECKQEYTPDDETLDRINLTRDQIGGRPFYFGKGCKTCNGTGYKGRKAIFEYLRISNPIRELINKRSPTLIIREKARELGMRTMREDGVRAILDGYTTVDEVLRYT